MTNDQRAIDFIASAGVEGASRAEITAALGISSKDGEWLMRRLRASGAVPFAGICKGVRYFARAEWAAAYVPVTLRDDYDERRRAQQSHAQRAARALKEGRPVPVRTPPARPPVVVRGKLAKPIVERRTKPVPTNFAKGDAIVPEHVVVQVLPGFTGDSRYAVSEREACGWGSFSDEWRRMRSGGSE